MGFSPCSLSRRNITANVCVLERLRNDSVAPGGQRHFGFLFQKSPRCQPRPRAHHVYMKTPHEHPSLVTSGGQNDPDSSDITRRCACLMFPVVEKPITVRLAAGPCNYDGMPDLQGHFLLIYSSRHRRATPTCQTVSSCFVIVPLHQRISASYPSHYPQSLASLCLLFVFSQLPSNN